MIDDGKKVHVISADIFQKLENGITLISIPKNVQVKKIHLHKVTEEVTSLL
jgi:hypothetical protein